MDTGRPAIVVYDGQCGFCRRQVELCRRRMKPGALRFVDNGSPEGQAILGTRGLAQTAQSTVIVLDGETVLTKSEGAIAVARRFRWPWRGLVAVRLVPRPWRDRAYDLVAQRRQRDQACVLHRPMR